MIAKRFRKYMEERIKKEKQIYSENKWRRGFKKKNKYSENSGILEDFNP